MVSQTAASVLTVSCLALGLSYSKAAEPKETQQEPAESPAAQMQRSFASISQEVRGVFEKASAAVVKIHGSDEHSEIYGTGFFIDPTGTLYTSYTVAGEAGNFTIEFQGKQYPAKQIVADIRSGVAMLKADLVSPALPVGKSGELEVATPVVTIGYPLDLPKTPSFGMVAGFDSRYMGRYFPTKMLRVNLPVQRGEAGAPLLNLKGEVVGMLVSSLENYSACYVLPIDAAEKVRSDFMRFGEVRQGWIGANVTETKNGAEGSSVETTDVAPGTPAAESGMHRGDIVLQIGKTKVHQPEDVLDASFFISAGDTVPITVRRGGQTITFQVQADLRPAADVHPEPSNVPTYPDGQEPPMSAGLINRAIPVDLGSSPSGQP